MAKETGGRVPQLSSSAALSDTDRQILSAFEPVVRGLAAMWGDRCEVVLHSLVDPVSSVIQIENGHVTGRSIGSPIMEQVSTTPDGPDQNFRIYFSRTADGRPLRSVTMVVRNEARPIGILCLNFDLTVSLHAILGVLGSTPESQTETSHTENGTMMSADDLVARSLDIAIRKSTVQRGVSPQHKNRAVVAELFRQGIFDIKGAVDLVSTELGLSRFTIYNYLRNLKGGNESYETDE